MGARPERALLYLYPRMGDCPKLHSLAAQAAQLKGLLKEARARRATAAALAPQDPQLRAALGALLEESGELDAAAREYREALRWRPKDPRLLSRLGMVERRRGQLEVAQRCLERVITLRPRDLQAWFSLGVCAFERGDRFRAREALDHLLKRKKRHYKARYQRALLDLQEGDLAQACLELEQVLKRAPRYGPAHFALGRSLIKREPSRARYHLKEAILGQPSVTRAHRSLGRLYERDGRLAEARAEYRLYQRQHPQRWVGWLKQKIQALDEALLERDLAAPRFSSNPKGLHERS